MDKAKGNSRTRQRTSLPRILVVDANPGYRSVIAHLVEMAGAQFESVAELGQARGQQDSEVGRAVAIVKMRDSNHKKGLWAFTITEHGFELLDKVEGVTGLLGWSALRGQKIE